MLIVEGDWFICNR